jgi:hypothetical protein
MEIRAISIHEAFCVPLTSVRTANHAIIFNAACQPEFRAGPDLFHPHCLGFASQIDYIIGVLRVMGRHNNFTLDSLAGSYRLIQQTIKAVPADISGFGT